MKSKMIHIWHPSQFFKIVKIHIISSSSLSRIKWIRWLQFYLDNYSSVPTISVVVLRQYLIPEVRTYAWLETRLRDEWHLNVLRNRFLHGRISDDQHRRFHSAPFIESWPSRRMLYIFDLNHLRNATAKNSTSRSGRGTLILCPTLLAPQPGLGLKDKLPEAWWVKENSQTYVDISSQQKCNAFLMIRGYRTLRIVNYRKNCATRIQTSTELSARLSFKLS